MRMEENVVKEDKEEEEQQQREKIGAVEVEEEEEEDSAAIIAASPAISVVALDDDEEANESMEKLVLLKPSLAEGASLNTRVCSPHDGDGGGRVGVKGQPDDFDALRSRLAALEELVLLNADRAVAASGRSLDEKPKEAPVTALQLLFQTPRQSNSQHTSSMMNGSFSTSSVDGINHQSHQLPASYGSESVVSTPVSSTGVTGSSHLKIRMRSHSPARGMVNSNSPRRSGLPHNASPSPHRHVTPAAGEAGGRSRRIGEDSSVAPAADATVNGAKTASTHAPRSEGFDDMKKLHKKMSLLQYVRLEIFGAEDHGAVDSKVNKTVKNFLSVPRQLERLLYFGLLICTDTFLYVTTFLPLRIIFGTLLAVTALVTKRRFGYINRTVTYDCMRGVMICVSLWALQLMQMSRVYHYIRGQAMIKLYVLIAMIEIFDKLMCSFGQDVLDSLYLSTRRCDRRAFMQFIVVIVYTVLHSFLLFLHVATLTVAVNSDDQALLTLLISNNFAEIKSSVFKKFDSQNLFQLCCHDIVERFKLVLFLLMILLQNVVHGGDGEELFTKFFCIFLLVMGGEVLADWIKHAFIIKFNQMPLSLYAEYSNILTRDITACRKDETHILDHTHFVSRRLAFASVPLNCIMLRFLQISAPYFLDHLGNCPRYWYLLLGFMAYLVLLGLKVLTGIQLMGSSYALHPEVCVINAPGPAWLKSPVGPKTKKERALDLLSTVNRFTVSGRIA